MRLKKFFQMFLNESFRVNDFMIKNFAYYLKSKGVIGIDAETLIAKSRELGLVTADDFIIKYPDSKIRKYAQEFFEEEEEVDFTSGPYISNEDDDDLYYGEDEEDYYEVDDDDDSEDNNEELNQMASMIHVTIADSGFKNFYVSNKGFNISVQFVLKTKEKFSSLMKLVGLIKRLKTEVLIQYDAELDLWETKRGEPLLTFDFYYNEETKGKVKKDDVPF